MKKKILIGIIGCLIVGIFVFALGSFKKNDNIVSIKYTYHNNGLMDDRISLPLGISSIYVEKEKVVIDGTYEYSLKSEAWNNLIKNINYANIGKSKYYCMDGYDEDITITFVDNSTVSFKDECGINDKFGKVVNKIKAVVSDEMIKDFTQKRKDAFFSEANLIPISKIQIQYENNDDLISKILFELSKDHYQIKIYSNREMSNEYSFDGTFEKGKWEKLDELIINKEIAQNNEKIAYVSIYRDRYYYDLKEYNVSNEDTDIYDYVIDMIGKDDFQKNLENVKNLLSKD